MYAQLGASETNVVFPGEYFKSNSYSKETSEDKVDNYLWIY